MQRFMTRCRAVAPVLAGGFWFSYLFVIVVLAILCFMPAGSAAPIIVDDAYDFNNGPLGWYGQGVGNFNPPDPGFRWTYADPLWKVRSEPVSSKTYATGNYLFSPVINVTGSGGQAPGQNIDKVRFSLAHSFKLPNSTVGYPIAAAQIAYSINGGPFQSLATGDFNTGSVTTPDPEFGASPLVPFVSQTALVAPTYTAGAGLFPLMAGGASFVGTTPGFSTALVPSVAIFDLDPGMVTMQFRLTNANLANECPADAGWNVRYVQVDFATPEPGTLALGAVGLLLAVGHGAWRRRRPLTTAPRVQA